MRQPSSPAVLALALLFLADPRTAGAALLDPTRPLAGGREEAAVPKVAEVLPAAAAAQAEAAAAPAAPPALQSLQVPQQGEATAIVDGQLLKVGGKLGSYEVTHIDAHGLLVRGPSGRERWTLAGIEVLDSRQSAASLKMGPLGDVRKPARRPSPEAAAALPDAAARMPQSAAPSPLVFPLPVPQGGAAPLLRPAVPPEGVPQPLPTAPTPARPAVKSALADAAPKLAPAALMTVAWQPAAAPAPRPPVSKRVAVNAKKWRAEPPTQALRMDLDDMRRVVQLVSAPAKGLAAASAASRWQLPLSPNPYRTWAAAWQAGPAPVPRGGMLASASPMLARWQPLQQPPRAAQPRWAVARYTPVQGPRPMPASVVWRQAAAPKAWQPQGVNDLPGVQTRQWATAPTATVRIAALEKTATVTRTFASAYSKPAPRTWAVASARWAGRSAPGAQALAPVTHTYPMALPQWRNAPTAQADNSSLTQVAYALETP